MQFASSDSLLFVLGLAAGPVVFLLILFGVNHLLAPRSQADTKLEAFECGIPQGGSPWRPVNIRFSTIALLFVIFDAEAVLLFAVAPGVRGSVIGAIEVGSFAIFLAFGLYYAWGKGALRWPS